ncbi:hypothetical protein Stube_02540 [Streptomyces tubercidicus]|uniref:Uncharacterized protein n=1 Tax=Streptomyces tubercidicus TaxID=47759 RepID=A0A640ULU0_9ACTN|nr:hypothetical protein Stube_02540 [Streptomyces tubercidicus]
MNRSGAAVDVWRCAGYALAPGRPAGPDIPFESVPDPHLVAHVTIWLSSGTIRAHFLRKLTYW